MSTPSAQHPTDRLLITFNLGKLDDSKAAAVNKHLKGCPTCRRRLVSLSGATEVPSPSTTPPPVPIANAKTLTPIFGDCQAELNGGQLHLHPSPMSLTVFKVQ